MSSFGNRIADSVQRSLIFSETGVVQFKNSNQIVLEDRKELDLYAPVDLWSHFRAVEHCSEFLDTTLLPLETPNAQKLKLSTTVKSPRVVISPRRSTAGNITKRDKKKKPARKKKNEEGSIEIFLSKSGEVNKKTAHPNILFAPRGSGGSISVESLDGVENAEELIQVGIELFNTKPRKGIAHWLENKIFKNTAEDIAKFLSSIVGLDKAKLGEYLSEEDSFPILGAFVRLIDFEYMDFDLALRKFLFCFRMPGEAQKIDRCMKNFASHYFSYSQSDNVFENELAVYAMAFGTIMLNTDAHNSQVRNKMTERQFIDNTQYIEGGEKIPSDFLTDLYRRILDEEIMLDPDKSCFPEAIMKGWLYLRSRGNRGHWKPKWVVLSGFCIYICKKPAENVAVYGIQLDGCSVDSCDSRDKSGRKYCLSINLPPGVVTPDSEPRSAFVLLSTQTADDLEKWKTGIKAKIYYCQKKKLEDLQME